MKLSEIIQRCVPSRLLSESASIRPEHDKRVLYERRKPRSGQTPLLLPILATETYRWGHRGLANLKLWPGQELRTALIPGFWRVRPNGAGQLDSHHGALRINWALFSDEGRSLPANDPKLNIWRLLTDERRHYASDSTQFDLDLKANRLSRRADY